MDINLTRKKGRPSFLFLGFLFFGHFIGLAVLLGELDGNHFATEQQFVLFTEEGTSGIGVTEELDERESLDGSIVWAGRVEIFGNVYVTNRPMLDKEVIQLAGRHITRQIASDQRLDLVGIE